MSLSYFADNVGGIEQLWVSDGTPAGTHMVKAFAANLITNLTMIGARVYFTVDDGIHGNELWVSDGTAAGTMLVSDIRPGATGSNPNLLLNVDGELFFAADDGAHGQELWETNGTAAGTVMVRDIDPGAPGSIVGVPFADVNGTLFFTATDGTHGDELWKSDGTATGTVLVKDINPGATDSFPELLTNVNGTLLFFANDGTHGVELWRSDGTAAGTSLVQDINPGLGSSTPSGVGPIAVVNGTLFFNAADGTHGLELWKSDGTPAGTKMIADINPGPSDSAPEFMTNVNGELFFTASDGVHGFELWKSDGTSVGTVMVKDINPGGANSFVDLPNCTANVGGTLFFAATDGMSGFELWKSDGTAAGTVLVKDIFTGAVGSDPEQFTNVNGVLEFYAQDPLSSTTWGLFRSDGTAAGTFEIASNVDPNVVIGFAPQPAANDLNGDVLGDILWRNASGTLADWSMIGGTITSGNALTSGGAPITQDASWSVAGISDFNGDGKADVLWRKTDGTLADWTMNGSIVASTRSSDYQALR
jgi:ELWxxDGT repeat protein